MINKTLYQTVALGGTFDHLHDGHKGFLKFAGEIAKFVIIGVTDQPMTLTKPLAHLIQPTYVRKQAVTNFCNRNGIKAKVVTINDPFGPTIEQNKIQALVCTNETLKGANKINEVRDKLHLKNLPIHIYNLKKDKLGIESISAQRVRAGEIDRKGTVYQTILNQDTVLGEVNRDFFSQLHGKLVNKPTEKKHSIKIVVGDSSLENFIKNNWQYDLGIFDYKRQRKEVKSKVLEQINNPKIAVNKPGVIQTGISQLLSEWKESRSFKHIFIKGEEDLTAVVAVLLMPLETQIYYGQPNTGMVETIVTEDLKEQFFAALSSN